MKKLLIISGAGTSEIPLIKSAKKLGFFVITTGTNETAVGHALADQYVYGDYSNMQEMLRIVDEYQIDHILPGCNDFALLSASYIHDKRQIGIFDSLVISQTLHHKDRFRTFCQTHHLTAPLSVSLEEKAFRSDNFSLEKHVQKLRFPLIVKPIDLASGTGIEKVENLSALTQAVDKAFQVSRETQIVIEEYISGEHYSASLLIHDGKIIFTFFAQEYFNPGSFSVAGAFSTTRLFPATQQHLLKEIATLINRLDLQNGLLHIQFVVRDSLPYLLEVTRRSPGDLYLYLVDHSVDIDYAELIIKSHCAIQITPPNKTEPKPLVRECVTAPKAGNTYTLTVQKSPHYRPIETFFFKNTHIRSGGKLAIVLLEFDSFTELYRHIPAKRDTIFKVTMR